MKNWIVTTMSRKNCKKLLESVIIKKRDNILYWQPLTFIHLDNVYFCQVIKNVQGKTLFARTGDINVTSQIRLYKELGLQWLKFRHYYRRYVHCIKLNQVVYMNIYKLFMHFIPAVPSKMMMASQYTTEEQVVGFIN